MTTTDPLTPDEVDLLVSAELDGALDGAAHDLGLEPDDARARLAATPGVAERRAAFAAAVAANRTPEPLPDAVRARLVAHTHEPIRANTVGTNDDLTARRVQRASIWNRRLVGAGAVAAALLLVVGVFASLNAGDDSDDSADGSAAAELDEVREYGDLSSTNSLRRALAFAVTPDGDDSGGQAPTGASSQDTDAGESFDPDDEASATQLRLMVADCTPTLSSQLADGAAPIARGTATYDGEPAGLVVFDLDGRRFAVVFDPSTCEPRTTLLGPP
ncbi:MAG TPA: hypothetical protein VFZ83_09110 [Acidimicrobiia bacterium]|nr:hypothetical protein [Acidimicrobiia bacterium]